MNSLFLLIPIALVFTAIALGLFWWAAKNKQFEELDRAAQDILFDDIEAQKPKKPDDEASA